MIRVERIRRYGNAVVTAIAVTVAVALANATTRLWLGGFVFVAMFVLGQLALGRLVRRSAV